MSMLGSYKNCIGCKYCERKERKKKIEHKDKDGEVYATEYVYDGHYWCCDKNHQRLCDEWFEAHENDNNEVLSHSVIDCTDYESDDDGLGELVQMTGELLEKLS